MYVCTFRHLKKPEEDIAAKVTEGRELLTMGLGNLTLVL